MHETDDDLAVLQRLLDDTHAHAGAHLREIHTDAVRLTAAELCERATGMRVAVVATVTADGRPLTGPVDAFLHRGVWHFGTSPTAVRARHLAVRPAVSLTWVEGEDVVVTAHGRVRPLELAGRDAGFAARMRDHYGPEWDAWDDAAVYFAVEATRLYAADMSRHRQAASEA